MPVFSYSVPVSIFLFFDILILPDELAASALQAAAKRLQSFAIDNLQWDINGCQMWQCSFSILTTPSVPSLGSNLSIVSFLSRFPRPVTHRHITSSIFKCLVVSPFQVQEHIEPWSSNVCRHGDVLGWGRRPHRCCSQSKQDVGGHTVHLYQRQRGAVRGWSQQHSTERRKAHPVGRWSAPCCFYMWTVSITKKHDLIACRSGENGVMRRRGCIYTCSLGFILC